MEAERSQLYRQQSLKDARKYLIVLHQVVTGKQGIDLNLFVIFISSSLHLYHSFIKITFFCEQNVKREKIDHVSADIFTLFLRQNFPFKCFSF